MGFKFGNDRLENGEAKRVWNFGCPASTHSGQIKCSLFVHKLIDSVFTIKSEVIAPNGS